MGVPVSQDVTGLLRAWSEGQETALERLVPLVYAELKRIAHRCLIGERPGDRLQTAELVNEAYLRLIDARQVGWQNRAHFFAISATRYSAEMEMLRSPNSPIWRFSASS